MNGTGPSVVATAASNYFDPDLLFLISDIGSYVDLDLRRGARPDGVTLCHGNDTRPLSPSPSAAR